MSKATTSLRACLVLAALILSLTASAPSVRADTGGDGRLALSISGIKHPNGAILIALYDNAAAYQAGGHPARAVKVPVDGPRATAEITGLAPGRYAFKAFHDLFGDGKLHTNAFGAPSEPYAFSNNAHAGLHPPSWEAAAFTVKAGANEQPLTIE